MQDITLKKRISKESIFSGTIAGVLWGSWAFYVHLNYEFWVSATAALTQGLGSAFVGAALTIMMDYIAGISAWPRAIKIVASIFLPMIIATAVIIVLHMINGTPNIIKTILPSQPLGYFWTIAYTLRLHGTGKRNQR